MTLVNMIKLIITLSFLMSFHGVTVAGTMLLVSFTQEKEKKEIKILQFTTDLDNGISIEELRTKLESLQILADNLADLSGCLYYEPKNKLGEFNSVTFPVNGDRIVWHGIQIKLNYFLANKLYKNSFSKADLMKFLDKNPMEKANQK